jgi:hypothetical protein
MRKPCLKDVLITTGTESYSQHECLSSFHTFHRMAPPHQQLCTVAAAPAAAAMLGWDRHHLADVVPSYHLHHQFTTSAQIYSPEFVPIKVSPSQNVYTKISMSQFILICLFIYIIIITFLLFSTNVLFFTYIYINNFITIVSSTTLLLFLLLHYVLSNKKYIFT